MMVGSGFGPKAIIDKCYVQAATKDGADLQSVVKRGYRLVLIDTFFFEFATDSNDVQWPSAQLKLSKTADEVECWYHTSEMLAFEQQHRRSFGCPVDYELTEQFRGVLRTGRPFVHPGTQRIATEERKARERDSPEALRQACALWTAWRSNYAREVHRSAGRRGSVDEELGLFVNDCETIRQTLGDLSQAGVDSSWVSWHQSKATLAFVADYMRRHGACGAGFAADRVGHEFVNRKHDLDYVVALAFADAIASNETRGDMKRFVGWIYGETKEFLTISQVRGNRAYY